MASKAATAADTVETREDAAETPLLDTIALAIKKMVLRGKERGYLTYDELNAALPQDQVSSEQIEDTMTMLSELGINVIESEESEEPAEGEAEEAAAELADEAEAEGEGEDADGEESSISLAAMEMQLTPGMVAIFDAVAEAHKKIQRSQDARVTLQIKGNPIPRQTERKYDKLKGEIIELLKRVRFNNTRIEHLVEQLYDLNRRLVTEEGKLLRLAEGNGIRRSEFLPHYLGDELAADWLERTGALPGRGWARLVERHFEDVHKHRAAIAHIAAEAK